MKQKASFILLFICCLLLSSCIEDKRQQSYPNETNTEHANTAKQAKIEKDTLNKDSVATAMENNAKERLQETKAANSITEDSSPTIWELLSLCIGGIALVLCIVIWYLMVQLEKGFSHIVNELEHDLDKKQLKNNRMLLDRCKQIEDKCLNIQTDYDRMSERTSRLETIQSANNGATNEKNSESEQINNSKNQFLKRGYFGIVKVGGGISMFNDYPKSRNEGAYFEVVYLDNDRCEFAPIDLERIRSIDAVGEAVEYNGDMAYAKSMKVRKKGKAVYDKEHDFWRITEKANIELKN